MFKSIVAPAQLSAMAELARKAPPGAIAEVGVYQGGSAAILYEVALAQGRELHLFDTFGGTPYHTEGLDRHKVDDEFNPPVGTVVKIQQLMPLAKLHIGIYPDTHPKELPLLAFVHCDCDQYLSYKAVIECMWPLVVPGGILLFDDYPYLEGAKKAVEENFTPFQLEKCHSRYYIRKASRPVVGS